MIVLTIRTHMKRIFRKLIALILLVVAIGVLSLSLDASGNAANKDFISYWAAGQLLVRGLNPYDAGAVFQLEKSVGFREPRPLIMRNPPFALTLALPLGLVSPTTGAVLWSLLIVASLMASVRILWSIHGRPPDRLHLLGYVFAPAVACMPLGQTSAFALFGLVLFLRLHLSRPFAAGMCLPLFLIKPHLFLVFGLVLLAWVLARRAYAVLAGGLIVLTPALLLPMWFKASVWSDYSSALSNAINESTVIPTVSTLVRVAVDRNALWVQFVPAALGCLWGLWYYRRHQTQWEWIVHGSLLALVSVLVSPYSWFTDEIVVLPAILHGIYFNDSRSSLIGFGVINGVALLGVLSGTSLGSGFFIWTTTAWLVWYVFVRRFAPFLPEKS